MRPIHWPGTARIPPTTRRVDAHHGVHSTHFAARLAARKPLQACQPSSLSGTDLGRPSPIPNFPTALPYCTLYTEPFLLPSHPYPSSTLPHPEAHRLHSLIPLVYASHYTNFTSAASLAVAFLAPGASFLFFILLTGGDAVFAPPQPAQQKFSTRPVLTALHPHSISSPSTTRAIV